MACECVASVLASDFRDFEVIVVDDCSPDDTGERIRARYGDVPQVRYVRNAVNKQLGDRAMSERVMPKGHISSSWTMTI